MNKSEFKKIIKESLQEVLGEDFESGRDPYDIITSIIPIEDIDENKTLEDCSVFVISKRWNNPFAIMKLTMILKEDGYTCKAAGNTNGTLSLYIYNY